LTLRRDERKSSGLAGRKQSAEGIANAIVGPVMRALAEMGYEPSVPSSPAEPVVDGSVADALIDAAAARLGDDSLGLSLAKRIPIGALGDLDYALCTSAKLYDGVTRAAEFYGVVTQRVRLTLEELDGRATLVFTRLPASGYSRHWSEFATAMLAQRVRQTLGREVVFDGVGFMHDPPADVSVHDAFFGTTVRFNQPRETLSFASDLLEQPLLTASASLAEVLEARMRQIQPSRDEVDPFIGRVRHAVVDLLDEAEAGVPATAKRLRTSARTLQRELHERGTSHQEILDDVRRERALRLLESGVTVAEVARRLGFSESSAFFRAFRRWTGASPASTRAGAAAR
jgi:AraC-like DNA-binding protein